MVINQSFKRVLPPVGPPGTGGCSGAGPGRTVAGKARGHSPGRTGPRSLQPVNQSIKLSIRQSVGRSISQLVNQSISQSVN